MKLNLYEQSGSDNHGCEAIMRSTIDMFNGMFESIELYSQLPESEVRYGLDKICNIHLQGKNIRPYSLEHIIGKVINTIKPSYSPFYNKVHCNYLKSSGISLQTGGDNYCYANQYRMLGYMNDQTRKKGMKSVLWGVSIEPDIIARKEVADNLKRYDLITVRESITKEAMKQHGIEENVVFCPDPAFTLRTADIEIEEKYIDAIGINVSPLIMKSESQKDIVYESYYELIDFILENTEKNILLIPHVVVKGNDDREPLGKMYEKYKETKRVFMLEDSDCNVLKAYIARCCFFVGARTHATIAAYSRCVPTLVVGYSVKAKGIAKDLFGSYENYVLPVQDITKSNMLKDGFVELYDKKDEIKKHLCEIMPEYIDRAYLGREAVEKLM